MADGLKQVLAKPIQLADQITKWADETHTFRAECLELKSRTERLSNLLRQAARADLYERPTRRIMDDTEQVLDKALSLVAKCRARTLLSRVFTIIPAGAFKKMSSQLDNSIGDVSWLLRVSKSNHNPNANNNDDYEDDDSYLGLPPIAANEPILGLIWEQIAKLHTGSLDDRADAAASLVSFARDNDRYVKLIVEEGGIPPLLKLVKEGGDEGQESATRALGLLGRDPESVEVMVQSGACSVFSKVLKEGPMKVQSVVAWAASELAAHHPKCQDMFAQNNAVRLLVSHLAFETVQEHSKYSVHPKATSIHHVLVAKNNAQTTTTTNNNNPTRLDHDDDGHSQVKHPMGAGGNQGNQMHSVVQSTMASKPNSQGPSRPPLPHQHQHHHPHHHHHPHGGGGGGAGGGGQNNGNVNLAGTSIKGREFEHPETKATMKSMAARALCYLARGNASICKSITESKALLCFAVLLEKGPEEVQFNSIMALMEIARVAEQVPELRRSAFKPTSPAAKAVVDQLLRIVEKGEYSDLLVPSIIALGCLSRTFRATETRIIGPLVRLIDERESDVMREALFALTKFACTENFLHSDHSKAIIAAGGVKHVVQLVYFAEQEVQLPALVLLCYIAMHVPDSEDLAQAEVLTLLEWASKRHYMVQDPSTDTLLPEAKSRLELYQARGIRGFH